MTTMIGQAENATSLARLEAERADMRHTQKLLTTGGVLGSGRENATFTPNITVCKTPSKKRPVKRVVSAENTKFLWLGLVGVKREPDRVVFFACLLNLERIEQPGRDHHGIEFL